MLKSSAEEMTRKTQELVSTTEEILSLADQSIMNATELKNKNLELQKEQDEHQNEIFFDYVEHKTLRDNLKEDTTQLKKAMEGIYDENMEVEPLANFMDVMHEIFHGRRTKTYYQKYSHWKEVISSAHKGRDSNTLPNFTEFYRIITNFDKSRVKAISRSSKETGSETGKGN